jgi:hypothetical protein
VRAIFIISSLLLPATWTPVQAERFTVDVTVGRKACRIVRIPHPWRIEKRGDLWPPFGPDDRFGFGTNDKFEFRALEGAEDREILISVYRSWRDPVSRQQRNYYSSDVYAFRVSGVTSVRAASKHEWDAAGPLVPFRFPLYERPDPTDAFKLEYKGHLFPRTGDHWPQTQQYISRLSADSRFLAVNSWSGVDFAGSIMGNSPGDQHGQYFVDIYQVDPPVRRVAITGAFHNVSPEEFQHEAFWLGKRFFVFPLNYEMTRFLFCDTRATDQ